jgi:hypothetical protein
MKAALQLTVEVQVKVEIQMNAEARPEYKKILRQQKELKKLYELS